MGLAYKPDDDDRESPTYVVMDQLAKRGAEVGYYDPYVPVVPETREHAEWAGTESVAWTEEVVSGYDLVVILTNHSEIDYEALHA